MLSVGRGLAIHSPQANSRLRRFLSSFPGTQPPPLSCFLATTAELRQRDLRRLRCFLESPFHSLRPCAPAWRPVLTVTEKRLTAPSFKARPGISLWVENVPKVKASSLLWGREGTVLVSISRCDIPL